MSKSLWEVIEESKQGNKYLLAKKQYDNFYKILSNLSKEEVKTLREEWNHFLEEMYNKPEYEKLHSSNGGIVSGGDDEFYIDFGSWIICQGKDLYNDFMIYGQKAIIEYIKKHRLTSKEYTFECMAYAFQDFE